jgi:hypothetical protein
VIVIFIGLETALWLRRIRPRIPFRPRYRRVAAMFAAAPTLLMRSILIAAIATIVVELIFRALVRPLMIRYYEPQSRGLNGFGHDLAFSLEGGEVVWADMPVRRVEGRRERPGRLVWTDRRVCFCPFDWRADPWEIRRDSRGAVATARAVRPARRVLGLVQGYPKHVRFEDGTQFAVRDPQAVLAWVDPGTSDPVRSP